MVLRHEVIFILFQRGQFNASATALTSQLLPFLLIGAFAFSAQVIVVRGYYAMQDTLFPAIFGTMAVALSIPFYIWGMGQWGPAGVAGGVSFSAFLQVIVLYALWNKRSNNRGGALVYGHMGNVIVASIVLGVILEVIQRTALTALDPWTLSGSMFKCLVSSMLFLMLLYGAGRLVRIKEFSDVFDLMTGKFRKIIYNNEDCD